MCAGRIRTPQAPGTAGIGEHAWIRLGVCRIGNSELLARCMDALPAVRKCQVKLADSA